MAGQKKPRDNKYNRPQRTGQNNSAKNNSAFQKGVQGGQNDMQSALQYQPTPEDIKPMMAGDQQQGQPPIQKILPLFLLSKKGINLLDRNRYEKRWRSSRNIKRASRILKIRLLAMRSGGKCAIGN